MEKDLNNLINVIKGLNDRLGSKAWEGKIAIHIGDNIEALFDLGDYGSIEIANYYIPALTFTEVKTNRTFCHYLENLAHLFARDNLELAKVSVKDFYKDYRLGVLFCLSDGFSEFLTPTRDIIKSTIFHVGDRATEIVKALNKTNAINVSVDLTALQRRVFNVFFNSTAKEIAKYYNTELELDLRGLKWDIGFDCFHIGATYLNKIADTISQLEKEKLC